VSGIVPITAEQRTTQVKKKSIFDSNTFRIVSTVKIVQTNLVGYLIFYKISSRRMSARPSKVFFFYKQLSVSKLNKNPTNPKMYYSGHGI
jgi:hypothetical protein